MSDVVSLIEATRTLGKGFTRLSDLILERRETIQDEMRRNFHAAGLLGRIGPLVDELCDVLDPTIPFDEATQPRLAVTPTAPSGVVVEADIAAPTAWPDLLHPLAAPSAETITANHGDVLAAIDTPVMLQCGCPGTGCKGHPDLMAELERSLRPSAGPPSGISVGSEPEEVPEPEPVTAPNGCEGCNGGVGEDPHAEGCEHAPAPEPAPALMNTPTRPAAAPSTPSGEADARAQMGQRAETSAKDRKAQQREQVLAVFRQHGEQDVAGLAEHLPDMAKGTRERIVQELQREAVVELRKVPTGGMPKNAWRLTGSEPRIGISDDSLSAAITDAIKAAGAQGLTLPQLLASYDGPDATADEIEEKVRKLWQHKTLTRRHDGTYITAMSAVTIRRIAA